VKPARTHKYIVLIDPVNQPMFLRNTPRPAPRHIAFEQFWLTGAFEWVTQTLLQQLIQLAQSSRIIFLLVAILLKS
jgi:hypothetical protein